MPGSTSRIPSLSVWPLAATRVVTRAGITAALVLTSLGAVAQTTFSYRGAALGADQTTVLAVAKKEFGQLIPLELGTGNPEEAVNVLAGTGFTTADQSCPYGAERAQMRPCHLVRYIFSSPSDGARLATVEVTQSFDVPISKSLFLKALHDTYGPARLRFTDSERRPGGGLMTAESFLWGGSKAPAQGFRGTYLAAERDLIGGRYVSAEVFSDQGMAHGYRLRIVDTDAMARSMAFMKEARNVAQERRRRAEAEKLKF